MYLVDTNVLSELRKTSRMDETVRHTMHAIPSELQYVSVMTLFEIEKGILLLERRDFAQASQLRSWFQGSLLPFFGNRVLSIDTTIALRAAQLHIPNPQPERDALIAATALTRGMTVITRNTADFAATGVVTLNPWQAIK